jgi:hypothetical protein
MLGLVSFDNRMWRYSMVHVVHAHPMRPGHSVKSNRVETAVMFVQHAGQSGAMRYPCRMTGDPDQVESNWRCGRWPNTIWDGNQASLHARPLSVWRFDSRWRLSQTMEELCSRARRWCAGSGSQRMKGRRQSFGRKVPRQDAPTHSHSHSFSTPALSMLRRCLHAL